MINFKELGRYIKPPANTTGVNDRPANSRPRYLLRLTRLFIQCTFSAWVPTRTEAVAPLASGRVTAKIGHFPKDTREECIKEEYLSLPRERAVNSRCGNTSRELRAGDIGQPLRHSWDLSVPRSVFILLHGDKFNSNKPE